MGSCLSLLDGCKKKKKRDGAFPNAGLPYMVVRTQPCLAMLHAAYGQYEELTHVSKGVGPAVLEESLVFCEDEGRSKTVWDQEE